MPFITDQDWKHLKNPSERIELCRRSFKHFFFYYFAKYMHCATPMFHYQMFLDAHFEGYRYLMWMMFRDSGKTAIARALVVWWIVYKQKRNIGWVGYDLKKASKNARAIANELQANALIIRDFGQLYYEPEMPVKQSKPKTIHDFLCSNGVYFRALSTQVSTRGELEAEFRPDAYVMDDFENDKTKGSFLKTESVINFMEETISGASVDCDFLFLCNYITKYGSVQHLLKRAHKNKNWCVRKIALIENGQITWPAKFVMTDKEAEKLNEGRIKKEQVKSVETMKRDMGSARFDQEYLNLPNAEGGNIIKEEWFMNGRGRYEKSDILMDETGNFYWETEERNIRGTVYTASDPAISKKESSDERAIVSVAKFVLAGPPRQAYYLVFESKAGRWGVQEYGQEMKNTREKLSPRQMGVESNGVQEAFREIFSMYGISTVALNPDTDKVRRMMRNVGDLEYGRVLFPSDGSCDDLLDELISFTGEDGKPDNRVDAFNYAMQMAKTGGIEPYKDTQTETTDSYEAVTQRF